MIRDRLPATYHLAFAGKLKEAAKLIYGLTDEQVYGDIAVKETVDEFWGVTPRHILQQIGTEVARNIHPDTWIKSVQREILRLNKEAKEDNLHPPNFVISDVRFLNEAKALKDMGGTLVRVTRPGIAIGLAFSNHASETEQEAILCNSLLLNSGTLEDLEKKVDSLMLELQTYS
jgi:hypothetical protein